MKLIVYNECFFNSEMEIKYFIIISYFKRQHVHLQYETYYKIKIIYVKDLNNT